MLCFVLCIADLLGESEPVPGSVDSTNDNFLETNNIGLQGTYCVSGAALGIVVGTGDQTVFGRIASLSNGRRTELTPMQREILRFVLIIASFIVTFVVIIIIIWYVCRIRKERYLLADMEPSRAAYLRRDHPDFIDVPTLIVSCVSVGIAFIPEGLPISFSMGLTIAAGIMKKNQGLCKSPATVETLGAVSVICSDKTGTLTKVASHLIPPYLLETVPLTVDRTKCSSRTASPVMRNTPPTKPKCAWPMATPTNP